MYLKDVPPHFFRPLVSSHREEYLSVLFGVAQILADAHSIALEREILADALERQAELSRLQLDVSDEEDYDAEPSGDFLRDNLAYILRLFLRVGWLDSDGAGDRATETLFITLFGQKLIAFIQDLKEETDQSGHVVNTYNNLIAMRQTPDMAVVCLRNAHKSAQALVSSIEMIYSKIKQYYTQMLQKANPEELLDAHIENYVKDVVDRVIFPLKVDDSVDRYKGPILQQIDGLLGDTAALNEMLRLAVHTRRCPDLETAERELLQRLNEIHSIFRDIEHYMAQLEEKNNAHIRSTRQKLTYMLSMDTSLRGNLIALLQDSRDRPDADWDAIAQCGILLDLRRVQDEGYYKPRRAHPPARGEELPIEAPAEADPAEIDAVIDPYGAKFTGPKVRAFARELLAGQPEFDSSALPVENDEDYLMSIFLATEGGQHGAGFGYRPAEGRTERAGYSLPHFILEKR